MDENKEEIKEEMLIDEAEAKKQFLEELKNKNKEEQKRLIEEEEAKLAAAKAAEEAKLAAEAKALEEAKALAYKSEETDVVVAEDKSAAVVVNEVEKPHTKFSCNSLKAAVVDTAVVGIVSIAGVGLLDLILRLIFGYYVVDYKGFFIIFMIVLLILYPVIMENTKVKETLGQKLSKKEVQERKE
ncbi:hypothetical protein Ccar_23965 [Clostridium carboxidivorans P7]|uniref:RDD domain-containing protein n=1 Tax=Clostridium carboxidivorans P7 TaxID=536227 RepID=C6Q1X8_9CLOT|nr:hypothetical protein [Clostridium carboxidivorans]AKN33714.1 hypothetical protein Ccar_23965 [Clostridium carboxidivorans P7]EET84495.1 conserved hypothetical protein [Clostridium carboxidivorans P7]EFG86687.1 hypothetical protein CLCAR_3637 [Clostridium carboxidivorans P7]